MQWRHNLKGNKNINGPYDITNALYCSRGIACFLSNKSFFGLEKPTRQSSKIRSLRSSPVHGFSCCLLFWKHHHILLTVDKLTSQFFFTIPNDTVIYFLNCLFILFSFAFFGFSFLLFFYVIHIFNYFCIDVLSCNMYVCIGFWSYRASKWWKFSWIYSSLNQLPTISLNIIIN